MTVKRILVPLDGSRLSEAIIPLAEALARDYEAALLLVRALPTLNSPEAEARAQEEAKGYLAGMAAALESRGLRAEWKVWYDAPDRALAEAARFDGVELVTMTTHGRGGFSRLLFGSVAESLVRMAPVPVLLVRGELVWSPGGLSRIVVPLDGSELSEAILPVVERLAGPFDFAIELVRAIEPLPTFAAAELSTGQNEAIIEMGEADVRAYLAKVAAPLESKGLRVNRSTRRGRAVDVILAHAGATGAGLIAMSTHGRTGIGRLFLGSVAERVLRAASVPVLLWKARSE
jgi:nucleotide-binding universal stress UspA family protein